jgi:hypothetical protein
MADNEQPINQEPLRKACEALAELDDAKEAAAKAGHPVEARLWVFSGEAAPMLFEGSSGKHNQRVADAHGKADQLILDLDPEWRKADEAKLKEYLETYRRERARGQPVPESYPPPYERPTFESERVADELRRQRKDRKRHVRSLCNPTVG